MHGQQNVKKKYCFIMRRQWEELLACVCKGTVDLMDLGSYLRWWLIKFFQRWEGELISYISWCTFSLETVLCLSRRTVYVTSENMERLGSPSCVWGGDCLWCSFATIARTISVWGWWPLATLCSGVFSVWAQVEILKDSLHGKDSPAQRRQKSSTSHGDVCKIVATLLHR